MPHFSSGKLKWVSCPCSSPLRYTAWINGPSDGAARGEPAGQAHRSRAEGGERGFYCSWVAFVCRVRRAPTVEAGKGAHGAPPEGVTGAQTYPTRQRLKPPRAGTSRELQSSSPRDRWCLQCLLHLNTGWPKPLRRHLRLPGPTIRDETFLVSVA